MFHRPDCFQKLNGKKASPIQQHTQRHMERRSMSRSPCSNNKKFFHHCNLSGHWEAKCWRLHPELHPRHHTTRRRVWRVKIEEDEEFGYPMNVAGMDMFA
jgi:hypothetical protein